jgi:uncharacterized cupredoxin-like copper-binding protein
MVRRSEPLKLFPMLLAAACLGAGAGAVAHEGEKSGGAKKAISQERYAWGREGDPRKAVRTIEVDMSDAMRFTPAELKVKRGDTVKFVVRNSGKVMHEMVLGTREELAHHAELMKRHAGMHHDEPYMLHVKPGGREVMTWTFTEPGTFMYGCLVPGHWEAGMKGAIVVTAGMRSIEPAK